MGAGAQRLAPTALRRLNCASYASFYYARTLGHQRNEPAGGKAQLGPPSGCQRGSWAFEPGPGGRPIALETQPGAQYVGPSAATLCDRNQTANSPCNAPHTSPGDGTHLRCGAGGQHRKVEGHALQRRRSLHGTSAPAACCSWAAVGAWLRC